MGVQSGIILIYRSGKIRKRRVNINHTINLDQRLEGDALRGRGQGRGAGHRQDEEAPQRLRKQWVSARLKISSVSTYLVQTDVCHRLVLHFPRSRGSKT